jgi:phosphomethylpyrimidine synthase
LLWQTNKLDTAALQISLSEVLFAEYWREKMGYTTQMDAARQDIITPEMEIVSAKENIDVEKLRELIAAGQAIIPANKNHHALSPNGIGSALRTKINVNLGTSRDWTDLDMEMVQWIWVQRRLWT